MERIRIAIESSQEGLTREEVSLKLDIPIQSVCPAVKSLLDSNRIGYRKVGDGPVLITRRTVAGKRAFVCFAQ